MENNFLEWDGKSPMWGTIAGNQLDDPVLDVPHHHAVRDAATKAAPAKDVTSQTLSDYF